MFNNLDVLGEMAANVKGLSSTMKTIYSMPSSGVKEKTLIVNFKYSQSFKHLEGTMTVYASYMLKR